MMTRKGKGGKSNPGALDRRSVLNGNCENGFVDAMEARENLMGMWGGVLGGDPKRMPRVVRRVEA